MTGDIRIERLTKRFGPVAAVRDLTLEVADREFLTLLGPSGCGKTTLLRLLAGFVRPDAGRISVGAAVLSSPEGVVPPERRGMGMVFQNYAIWPHKTVLQNVAFGLEVRRLPRAETRARAARALELVHLEGLGERYPNQLSGGQQQRVALARSLVVEPRILLLDEPLSNLDAKLRERMRWELKELQRRTGITFVYVTHDQAEAMALSDRIAVLHGGELMQVGGQREVYSRPASRTVADFMGLINLIPAWVRRAGREDGEVALAGAAPLRIGVPEDAIPGQAVQVAVRPEHLRIGPPAAGPGSDAGAVLPARVAEVTFLGNLTDCVVLLDDGTRVRVQAGSDDAVEVGQAVGVRLDSRACTVFRA